MVGVSARRARREVPPVRRGAYFAFASYHLHRIRATMSPERQIPCKFHYMGHSLDSKSLNPAVKGSSLATVRSSIVGPWSPAAPDGLLMVSGWAGSPARHCRRAGITL